MTTDKEKDKEKGVKKTLEGDKSATKTEKFDAKNAVTTSEQTRSKTVNSDPGGNKETSKPPSSKLTSSGEPTAQKTQTIVNQNTPSHKQADQKRQFTSEKSKRRFTHNRSRKPQSEFEEKIIDIARVTNVVKGGRRFSFSVTVVVGDKKGRVGWGHGKANEVPSAIKKAIKKAQNNLISVPVIDKRTVPHEQIGKFLASKVLVKPAPKGKGIIAAGVIRSVVELAGYNDIYTKSLGSRSKANAVKATFAALKKLRTIEEIAKLRDLKVENILK